MESGTKDSWLKSLVLAPEARDRKHIERELAAQAFRSGFFRQQLITHPRSVLHQVFGAHIPEDIAIHVHEETPTSYHLVLPARAAAATAANPWVAALVYSAGKAYDELDAAASSLSLAYDDLERSRIERHIIHRARTDAQFHAALVKDPRQVLAEVLQVEIPEDYRVHVHQESATQVHLVIRNNPDLPAEVRERVPDGPLRTMAYGCPDQCITAAGTTCGTCTLVTYCTQPPC
jgi:hypothetical protein